MYVPVVRDLRCCDRRDVCTHTYMHAARALASLHFFPTAMTEILVSGGLALIPGRPLKCQPDSNMAHKDPVYLWI